MVLIKSADLTAIKIGFSERGSYSGGREDSGGWALNVRAMSEDVRQQSAFCQ